MTNVLVLGATGQIARRAIPMLADQGASLTLFARSANALDATPGVRVIEGDVLDNAALDAALEGQDIVYANLGGEIATLAHTVTDAMERIGVQRLVFIASLGIFHELPPAFEAWNQQMIGGALTDYRRASDLIEASEVDYTIIRPAWLTDVDEVDYEITERDEQFRGTEVSRKSVAAFVASVVADPSRHSRANVGIDKPGTDGDKPSFY